MDLQNRDDIYIFHDGQQYGPLTFAQILQFYQKRAATSSDLYWIEGMSNWLPLPELLVRPSSSMPPIAKSQTLNEALMQEENIALAQAQVQAQVPSSHTESLPLESVSMQEMDMNAVQLPQIQAMNEQAAEQRAAQMAAAQAQMAAQAQAAQAQMAAQAQAAQVQAAATTQAPIEELNTKPVATLESNVPKVNPTEEYAFFGKNGLGGFMFPVILTSLFFLVASIFAFYQFIIVFINTLSISQLNPSVGKSNLSMLALFAGFGSFAAVSWALALNMNLFRKRRVFPSMFRATIGVTSLFAIIILGLAVSEKMGWSKLTTPIPNVGQILPKTVNFFGTILEMPLAILLGALALLTLWMYLVIYVTRSRRVQNTFIR